MSAHHVYRLTCDHAGCDDEFFTSHILASSAREEAAEYGWTYSLIPTDKRWARSVDLCPAHSTKEAT